MINETESGLRVERSSQRILYGLVQADGLTCFTDLHLGLDAWDLIIPWL